MGAIENGVYRGFFLVITTVSDKPTMISDGGLFFSSGMGFEWFWSEETFRW